MGVAIPDALQYFRIAKLKAMGCNAYRTSHNPPTPELPDGCDRLGMIVMDENRLTPKCTASVMSARNGLYPLSRLAGQNWAGGHRISGCKWTKRSRACFDRGNGLRSIGEVLECPDIEENTP